MSLVEAIQEIKGRTCGGSSIADGVTYQEIPGSKLPFHRGKTAERVIQIIDHVDITGRTVLDIGCSVGAMSRLFQIAGAHVKSVDYDEQSIDVAKELRGPHIKTWDIERANIDLRWAQNLGEYDVIVWLSQWMWSVKQLGLEAALDLLHEVSRHCKTLVFESAANDGEAAIKGATQQDIAHWLEASAVQETIKVLPPVGGWHARPLFICRNPRIVWKGFTGAIERVDRGSVRKTYREPFWWMAPREASALKRLHGESGFPRLLVEGEKALVMSWRGWKSSVSKAMADQGDAIIESLAKAGIRHRDVLPDNLVAMNGELTLLDFGWCLFDDEDDTPLEAPSCLGEDLQHRRWGVDDADAMKTIFREM